MLKDDEILSIILQEESDALTIYGQSCDINLKRKKLIDYYNQELYGGEQKGKSKIVTSEVFQVVEGMIPPLMRLFLQNKNIAEFRPKRKEKNIEKLRRKKEHERLVQISAMQGFQNIQEFDSSDIFESEAQQKTALSNHIFTEENSAENILYNMLKDGLLKFTGWIQTYYEESECKEVDVFSNISEEEISIIEQNKGSKIVEIQKNEDDLYNLTVETKETKRKICIENIPPEEMIVSSGAKDLETAILVGQRAKKTRSEIKRMGLASDEVIDSLAQESIDLEYTQERERLGKSIDKSAHELLLKCYYVLIDIDEDGILELWHLFICSNKILKKQRVNSRPYSLFVPIPTPHQIMGTTPVYHMHEYQLWMSTLVRQMNDNIYTVNVPRYFLNERVNLEDFVNSTAGSYCRVKGNVGDSVMLMPVNSMSQDILQAIDYVQSMIEKTTGITAYNQGMDSESLNKTATGFVGVRDMSMMRIEVIARHAAVTIEDIYNKIIKLLSHHQNDETEVLVSGKELKINPKKWSDESRCVIDVGLGGGERQESVQNLSYMLEQAKYCIEAGIPVADSNTIYKILDIVASKVGLKTVEGLFNNTEKPQEILQAENEKMKAVIQQQQQIIKEYEPMANVEKTKAQAMLIKAKSDAENNSKERIAKMAIHSANLDHEKQMKKADLLFQQEKLSSENAVKLTDIQSKTVKNVKGDLIDG